MSWSARLSRFSPFGRSSPASGGTASPVTDSDYSYITPSDLDAHNIPHPPATVARPARESDVLVFRHKKTSYPTHFKPYSIDNGALTIGEARQAAARKLLDPEGRADARRVRMFWKGRNLKDDARSIGSEGLRSADNGAEILCVVGEPVVAPAAVREEEDEEAATAAGASGGDDSGSEAGGAGGTESPGGAAAKRKRNRSRKKKGGKRSGGNTGTTTPLPDGGVPLPAAAVPQTPLAKLGAIAAHFQAALLPLCEAYVASPPADKVKREYEHRKLTETVLQQVLLKVDGVETEGVEEVRLKRKELVREVQGWLTRMDELVRSMA